MSTDPHLEPKGRPERTVQGANAAHGTLPRHDTVSYEARDIKVRSIYWYLIALTISVAASFFICIYVLALHRTFCVAQRCSDDARTRRHGPRLPRIAAGAQAARRSGP